MRQFSYKHNQTTFWATCEPFAEDGYSRFRIVLQHGGTLVIASAGWATFENPIIWVQSHGPGDEVYAHDLVQAIGEGMELVGVK